MKARDRNEAGGSDTNGDSFEARFSVGDLVHHRLFDYRGIIADVDSHFEGTEQWYRQMARSSPPRDKPWYHVLVHHAGHQTYVAERNLEPDPDRQRIEHPLVEDLFERRGDGRYVLRRRMN